MSTELASAIRSGSDAFVAFLRRHRAWLVVGAVLAFLASLVALAAWLIRSTVRGLVWLIGSAARALSFVVEFLASVVLALAFLALLWIVVVKLLPLLVTW